MRPKSDYQTREQTDHERFQIVQQLQEWLEWPMIFLGLAWLILLVLEFVWGVSRTISILSGAIWVIFILDFALKFLIAPQRRAFLAENWLTALSLAVPALRVLRISRLLILARAGRGLRLFRVVASMNRGMRALRAAMSRRGFGYVLALSFVIIFVSAAGMYAFESTYADGLHTYPDALWWTAMVVVTMGSGYWPQSGEGKLLCLGLSLYGFGILGYVTASLASFFVGRDADSDEGEVAGNQVLQALRDEIAALRQVVVSGRGE